LFVVVVVVVFSHPISDPTANLKTNALPTLEDALESQTEKRLAIAVDTTFRTHADFAALPVDDQSM
jgi:hypothetical protein